MRRLLFCNDCLCNVNLFSAGGNTESCCFSRREDAVYDDNLIFDNVVGRCVGEFDDVGD